MATTEHRVIGQPVGRADGPEKVTGAGKYSIDIVPAGTLWCKVLRSPYAHARIVSIDASAALALPGVHAVITGKDVEGMRWGKTIQDEPIIAWDRALYIGDKVAAVAADDEETAEQALGLIDVVYEELHGCRDDIRGTRRGRANPPPRFQYIRRRRGPAGRAVKPRRS